MFTSLKRNTELNPDALSLLSQQSHLTSELWGYIYRGTSTKRSHTPLRIPSSMKKRPRDYARQGKGQRGCFNLETPSPFRSPCLQDSQTDATVFLAFARRMRWTPRKPSDREAEESNQTEPVRNARKCWYHISSEVFWGRAPTPRIWVIHWCTQPMSSFTFSVHAIRKEAPSLKV